MAKAIQIYTKTTKIKKRKKKEQKRMIYFY